MVRLVATGLTNAETATRLHISAGTVKTHLGSVRTKFPARNPVEIAAWAWQSGLAGARVVDTRRMRVIARDGVHEIEIQRSRFLCSVGRVTDEAGAAAFIAGVRKEHWSASHNCSAFRLDGTQRSSDDGEPAGTAGVPMLEVLVRRDLTDTVAVVTRYFGGVKLGAGGLVRAYGRAVSETIDTIGTLGRARFATFTIAVDHGDAGRVENALRAAGHLIAEVTYDRRATITVHIPEADAPTFHDWLAAQTAGTLTAEPGPPVDLDV